MYFSKPIPKKHFLIKAISWLSGRKQQAPIELHHAINECATMQQLLDLLFSTDFIKDEAMLAAFDKRIEELESAI